MAIEVEVNDSAVSLPDIPDGVLDTYPYATIIYMTYPSNGMEGYMLICMDEPLFLYPASVTELSFDCLAISDMSTQLSYNGYMYIPGETDEWELQDTSDGGVLVPIGDLGEYTYLLAWTNYDVCYISTYDTSTGIGTPTDEVYFANSTVTVDPVYVEKSVLKKSTIRGIARQARRLSTTSESVNPSQILSILASVHSADELIMKTYPTGAYTNDRVSMVGDGVFASSPTLTSVSFPYATSIGNYAFDSCYGLRTADIPLAEKIESHAFNMCSRLSSINCPLITNIGVSAFESTALTEVSFEKVTTLGAYAFSHCDQLVSVNFPALESVGNHAFAWSDGITSITLPAVTTVESSAFYWCTALTSVSLPLLTSTAMYMFTGCSALISIELPSVTTISGGYVFQGCSALEILDLPAVTAINGYSNFYNCTALKALILRSETLCTLANYNSFTNSSLKYVYVPSALVSSYTSATGWKSTSLSFRALEDYTEDGTITGALDESKI